jgi:hypothetical protein
VTASGAGTAEATVQVPTAGRYLLWAGGMIRDRLDTLVDGNEIGTIRNQLNNTGQWTPLGEAELAAGRHTVSLRYHGPDWRPGSGGAQFAFGPLALATKTAVLPVRYVQPANARSLCGKSLDWIEALGA